MRSPVVNLIVFSIVIMAFPMTISASGNRDSTAAVQESPERNLTDYGWSAPGFTTDFTRMSIDPAGILSGGPPKDGIPAIDNPSYESLETAGIWLTENEPVILVRINDTARIYPLQILTWHEIVNDKLDNVPLVVSFCPLCNTGVVFKRNYKGQVLDFGTTGRLRNSNLIMYDRQTESWWQQATGDAIAGKNAGERLEFHPGLTLSFGEAKKAAPGADVLSKETGFSRPYGQNPYSGYDAPGSRPFLFQGPIDSEMDAMDRVLVLKHNGEEKIIAYSEVPESGLLELDFGGDPIVIFRAPDTVSALDTPRIADGRKIGSLNAFLSRAAGEDLNFSLKSSDRFSDSATGSLWNSSGLALSGDLEGEMLEPLIGIQHFWFSAQAF
jgi:hypothetical protein